MATHTQLQTEQSLFTDRLLAHRSMVTITELNCHRLRPNSEKPQQSAVCYDAIWQHSPTSSDALHDLCLSAHILRVVLLLVKGVAAAQHRVQHDSSAPDVRQLGIISRRCQHLWSCEPYQARCWAHHYLHQPVLVYCSSLHAHVPLKSSMKSGSYWHCSRSTPV